MNMLFAETLKKHRIERGLSQRELADLLRVTRSTVARWENGSRMPDAMMISRLSQCLEIDVNTLLGGAAEQEDIPNVIMVDDRKIILTGGLPVLKEVLPNAVVTGFLRPSEAVWPFWISSSARQAGWTSAAGCLRSIPAPMWCF